MAKAAQRRKAPAKPAERAATSRSKPSHLPLRHLVGCPADKDRIESYELKRPRNGRPVTVTRCVECGSSVTDDDANEGDA